MGEAMRYAVRRVDSSSEELFGYSFKLGEIYGPNEREDVRPHVLKTFTSRVLFLIGPYSPETSYVASILTGTFGQIAISYSAAFSDFDSKAMLRTITSNFYRVQALLELVKRLEWNYSKLSRIGVCLGEQIYLPKQRSADHKTFDNAVVTIQKDPRIKAIILFTVNDDSRSIMKALNDKKLEYFYRIICAFGCTNYRKGVEEVEDVALGTISFDIHYRRDYEFEKHFLSLTPESNNDSYFIAF